MLEEKKATNDECIDACIVVGQKCWENYCDSTIGSECVELLPSEQVRERAYALFLLGFCSRILVTPDVGSDRVTEEKELNRLWIEHLQTSGGEIILDGFPFPFTSEAILGAAKGFFRLGYRAGFAVRQQLRRFS